MSAATAPTANKPTGFLTRFMPSEVLLGKGLILFGLALLVSIIVFPLHLNERLPFSIFPSLPIAFFMIIMCLGMRGPAVLRWTPMDTVFATWCALTILSQLQAPYMVNRITFEVDFITVQMVFFNLWFIYRAAYGFAIVNPRFASIGSWRVITSLLVIACIIGILQSIGPVQMQAVELAYRIGAGQEQILLGASELTGVRTTSVFSGPNIFGFINLFASCIILGWCMSYGRAMRDYHAILTMIGLGIFGYANLNSQSRSSFAISLIIIVVFIIFLIRMRKWRALFIVGLMALMGLMGVFIRTQSGEYEYMTKVFKTGVTQDESFLVRQRGISQFTRIASDIPLLGVGPDYYSVFAIGRGDIYSKANGTGDNGIAMAYFLLGVPGLIHLFFLNYVCFQALRKLQIDNQMFIASVKYVGGLVLGLYILTMPFSIRYHKLETFSYFCLVFGIVFAVLDVQKQKFRRVAAIRERAAERARA